MDQSEKGETMPEKDDLDDYGLLDVLGKPGLKQYGGVIDEEWMRQLKGDKAVKAYQEMRDNDPVIGGILYAVKTLVRQTEWRVEPGDDTPAHQEVADFIEECRQDMGHTWHDLLSEILSMLPFGWSYFECVYKYRRGPDAEEGHERSKHNDGKIGWRKIAIRSQETLQKWEFDEDGSPMGMWQQPPPDYKVRFIPIDKALLFRTETHKTNPEGRSILRNAYRSWFYLKRIQEIEAVGIERDLAGLPVAHVPLEMLSPSASAAQKNTVSNIFEMVRKVKRNEFEGVVFPAETDLDGNPSGFKFSLLSSGGRRPIDVNEIVKRYESRIALSVLGEFVLLGMDSVGSFALSSNKTHLFAQALGSYLQQIADVFNRFAIPRLLKLNGISPDLFPVLTFSDIETPDLGELAASIGALSSAGILTPDDELERWIREFGNMPMPDVDSSRGMEEPGGYDEGLLPEEEPQEPQEPQGETETNIDTGGAPVAAVTLNGAQVASLLEIISQVVNGLLPRESAQNIIQTSFNVSAEVADGLLGSVGQGFVPSSSDNLMEKSYADSSELPDSVRSSISTAEGRALWLRTYNEVEKETKDPSRAASEAWAALARAGYQKTPEGTYQKEDGL